MSLNSLGKGILIFGKCPCSIDGFGLGFASTITAKILNVEKTTKDRNKNLPNPYGTLDTIKRVDFMISYWQLKRLTAVISSTYMDLLLQSAQRTKVEGKVLFFESICP